MCKNIKVIVEGSQRKRLWFKALSDIIEDKYKIKWTDFEIINDKAGNPHVQITQI